MKNCLESNKNGKVAVLFSGGNDCSLVALKYLKRNYCVDLLHFCHGANISNNLHRIRYQELEKVAPERIQLVEISHKGMFRKFSLQDIEVDFAEHKTSMICLGCRLAMHVEAIMYCKKNDIKIVADGSVKYQEDFPEQDKEAIRMFRQLYSSYGIKYETLLSEISSAKQVKYELLDNGISMQSLEDTCLFSNTFSKANKKEIISFLTRKIPLAQKYLFERMQMEGVYVIDKIGGVIINDGKVLGLRKKKESENSEFIIPGGKREDGETDVDTLIREIKEETNLDVRNNSFLGEYYDMAVFENVPIRIRTYIVEVDGELGVQNEIKEYRWLGKEDINQNVPVGSVLAECVFPELLERKMVG